jgi:hypothetical protein
MKTILGAISILALLAMATAYQTTNPNSTDVQFHVQLAEPSPTPTFEQRISILSPLVVRVTVGQSSGSGLILDSDAGIIVTAFHVVEEWVNNNSIMVDFPNGMSTLADLIYQDSERDLAWLRLKSTRGLPDASISVNVDFRSLRPGQQIIRFGYGSVSGELQGFAPVATGIVSSVFRNDRIIQLDASAIPGDSGGPVFTTDGQLIGIVTSKLTGQFVEGVTYAVGYPANVDAEFLSASAPVRAPTPTPTPTPAPLGDWILDSDGDDHASVLSLNANPYGEDLLLAALCLDEGERVFFIYFGVELDWEFLSLFGTDKGTTTSWSVDSTYPRFEQEVEVREGTDDLNSVALFALGQSSKMDRAYSLFEQDIRHARLLVVSVQSWQWGGLTVWFPIAGADYAISQLSCGWSREKPATTPSDLPDSLED